MPALAEGQVVLGSRWCWGILLEVTLSGPKYAQILTIVQPLNISLQSAAIRVLSPTNIPGANRPAARFQRAKQKNTKKEIDFNDPNSHPPKPNSHPNHDLVGPHVLLSRRSSQNPNRTGRGVPSRSRTVGRPSAREFRAWFQYSVGMGLVTSHLAQRGKIKR